MVLTPLSASVATSPVEGGSDAGGVNTFDGVRFSPMSEWSYNFSVENPTSNARGPEMAWVEVGVPPGLMYDIEYVSLFDRDSNQELPVGILAGDVTTHPDGSLHRVTIHFKDSWADDETKDYRAVFGRRSQVTGGLMSASESGEFVVINDGTRQYQVHIEDSVFSQAQGLYYLYILNGELRAHGSALTRVGGNQLDPDQASFQMWWGRHSYLDIDRSPLAVRVTLGYDNPEIVHWGPAGATVQQIVRNPDFISAEIVLTFYKGIPRIDVHSEKTINEQFWNHNGFVMEFSAILGDGADWQGEFETVYGTNLHHVMTTTTDGPTWTRQSTTWQDVNVASDAAPAFYDLDDDGDLDMVLGSEDRGLKVYENVGDASAANMVENTTWTTGLPNVTSATPTLGDLDGDGDAELLIGQVEGYLKLYRNDGGASGPPNWTRWMGNFDRLGLGPHTAPNLGDADGDGDLDIVVGLGNGKLKGIINTGTPTSHSWSMDDKWVQHLSQGLTKAPCDGYSVPFMVDVDYDGDTDLLLGSDDGKVIVFENVGDARNVLWTRLDVSHHAGVVTGSHWESNSTPVMVDIDADGDRDLLIGTHRGTIYHYSFDGNTTPAKGHNNLQPLLNGTYRHMRDKDGNDGPFAVEGYGTEWYGYYVLANPRNGYSAMRYIPDWDRLAYKQEYWGDEFGFAGGNVSYYPYEPRARENVTRAQITSNAMSNGVSAGTFISQTGTSAGFVMQPMTAMVYDSDEILLLDLQRQEDPANYDRFADILTIPLNVIHPVDLSIEIVDVVRSRMGSYIWVNIILTYRGSLVLSTLDMRLEITVGPENDRIQYGNFTYQEKNLEPGVFEGQFGIEEIEGILSEGSIEVKLTIDSSNTIVETDELNNVATYVFDSAVHRLPWFDSFRASASLSQEQNPALDPEIIVLDDGDLYVVWEVCRGKEEIDIVGRTYDPEGTFGPTETIISGSHYAVEPDLALDDDGVLYMAYSSNIEALNYYHETAHAKYYWGEKFDLWVAERDQGIWNQPDRWTNAVDYDHSDQAPAIISVGGEEEVFYRNTYFEFYTGGNQMNNIPFQEMDIRMIESGQGTGPGNITMSVTDGSQAWWGGPEVARWGDDKVWVVYASEVGNNQWDIYADAMDGTVLDGLVRLTNTNGIDEVRPAIASGGPDPELLVAYETTRNGNRDIAVRWRSPNANPNQGWSPEMLITTDLASDMKPTVAYDGQGNYWVAWESYRTGNKDIFVSKFDGETWSGPFRSTFEKSAEEEPALACDVRTGRVFLAYESDRPGMGRKDIYIQHMLLIAPEITLFEPEVAYEDSPAIVNSRIGAVDLWKVLWDWGDGNTSETFDGDGEHIYTRAGTYMIIAKVFDRSGLESEVAQVTIVVRNVPPVANLTGDLEIEEDAVASFTSMGSTDTVSDVPSLTVEWDFGDGTGVDTQPLPEGGNVTHTYTMSGVYNVSVIITDDDGDTGTRSIKIRVLNLPPTVDAWARFEDLDEDEEGGFSGTGTDTPSDTTRDFTYYWEWGDGTSSVPSDEPQASHSYSASGIYQAILHVVDDDGEEGTAVVNVTVGNLPPTIEVTGSTVVDEDEEVTLTATATDTSHDQELLEFLWDWGDGTTLDWSDTSEATHTYTGSGNFQVTVTVRDDDGEEVSVSLPMAVDNIKPVAKASASKAVVAEGGTVHFSAAGSMDTPSDLEGLTYTWDLGSEFVEEVEFDFVFKSPGLYSITLTVSDDDGETSRVMLDIVVTNRPPVAEGWVGPLEVKTGMVIGLDASNSTDDQWDMGGLKYRWDMIDGTVYNTPTASHIYLYPGSYSIRLTVTDGDGDSHEWVTMVTVQPADQDDDDEGGMSTAVVGGLALVVLVVIVVAVLLVLRSRGRGDEDDEVEPEETISHQDDPTGVEETTPEQEPEPGSAPEVEEKLVVEEVEVVRPREGEMDPKDLIQKIERDLGPDGD